MFTVEHLRHVQGSSPLPAVAVKDVYHFKKRPWFTLSVDIFSELKTKQVNQLIFFINSICVILRALTNRFY